MTRWPHPRYGDDVPDSEDRAADPATEPADLFSGDAALVEAVRRHGAEQHAGRLRDLATVAGSARSLRWAEFADRYPPTLRSHDAFGNRVDEVEYHPAWHRLMQAGVRAGLAGTPWLRDGSGQPHTVRAAALLLWAQADIGHLTPLSSTHAVAPALAQDENLSAEWLPRLASRSYESALRPPDQKLGAIAGLAVTERPGGTDLRSSTTVARPEGSDGGSYLLTGHKWFVSAPMSDAFLVLAQAHGGPTTFLVPRVLPDGERNPWHLQRLKTTLGTRATGAAEVELDHTWGRRVGDEGRGLRTLAIATTALRRDGVVISAGMMRACVVRAIRHSRGRQVFGSSLADKPLMQNVLADLAVESEAATTLAMRLAAAVDAGENDLLRVIVPVAKYWVAKRVPQHAAEALECLGGNGYVEDHGLARVYRAAVLPSLWEGTGNLTALDVLRTMSLQPRAMEVLLGEIDRGRGADARLDQAMDDVAAFLQAAAREARRDPAAVEAGARWMVERLAIALQASLVVRYAPTAVATAYLATRVAGGGGFLAGTLPVGRRTTQAIIDRALPH